VPHFSPFLGEVGILIFVVRRGCPILTALFAVRVGILTFVVLATVAIFLFLVIPNRRSR